MFIAAVRWRLVSARHRDRGAAAVLVAILLGSGVLLGVGALALDVGNLYAERAQLVGGADAAALKVAQTCASPTGCNDSLNTALRYAEANANDGAAAVTDLCGRGGGGEFSGPCSAPSGALRDCIGSPPADPISYVEVHTSTRLPDGTTFLPSIFAQAVIGDDFQPTVRACARAAWGPPSRANGFALTISACDWNRYTNDGNTFDAVERSFPVYDETASSTCAVAAGAGAAAGPGGFRWLTAADDDCRLMAEVGMSYAVNTGDSRPNTCQEDDLTNPGGRPVLVPVFSSYTGGTGNAEYTVSGFAAFVVTGWHLPGAPGRGSCPVVTSKSCIYGYFTQAAVPGGGAVGGPDLRAHIVARAG